MSDDNRLSWAVLSVLMEVEAAKRTSFRKIDNAFAQLAMLAMKDPASWNYFCPTR